MVQYNGFSYTHLTNLYAYYELGTDKGPGIQSRAKPDMVPALSETK